MRIGNRKDAMIAWESAQGHYAPKGFNRLQGGGCREVLTKDDVVYKVQTSFADYMVGYGNRTEYNHARALRRQSDNGWIGRVYIPATTGYAMGKSDIVIAMERIHGESASWHQSGLSPVREQALWELFQLGFGDMHAGNYMWLAGRKVGVSPVDMGSFRYRTNPIERADTRVLSGTKMSHRVSSHREWKWRNANKNPRIAKSCPCRCGLVRWDT